MTHSLPLFTITSIHKPEGYVILELSLLLKDVPGAIYSASNVIKSYNGDIKWGVTHESDKPGLAWWCTFLLVKEDLVDVMIDSLRKLDVVSELNYTIHKDKIIITKHHDSIICLGGRAILFRTEWLKHIHAAVGKTWGKEGAKALAYVVGVDIGKAAHESHVGFVGDLKEELLNFLLDMMKGSGWISGGSWEKDGDKYIIRLNDLFECEVAGESHLVRGELAGYVTAIRGRDYKATEVKCRARGDEHCEFIVEPVERVL